MRRPVRKITIDLLSRKDRPHAEAIFLAKKEDNGNEVAVISFMYYRLRCRHGAYRLWHRTKLVPQLGYKEIKSMVVDILKTDEGKSGGRSARRRIRGSSGAEAQWECG